MLYAARHRWLTKLLQSKHNIFLSINTVNSHPIIIIIYLYSKTHFLCLGYAICFIHSYQRCCNDTARRKIKCLNPYVLTLARLPIKERYAIYIQTDKDLRQCLARSAARKYKVTITVKQSRQITHNPYSCSARVCPHADIYWITENRLLG